MKLLLVFGILVTGIRCQNEDITCTTAYCEVSVNIFYFIHLGKSTTGKMHFMFS